MVTEATVTLEGNVTLQLTEGQERARTMVGAMLREEGACFGVLSGYAGTGKTTMLGVLAKEHGPPLVLAPTGKAALRVGEACGLEALTIHRWMKTPREDSKTGDVKYVTKPLDQIQLPGNHLVIVDEASMVSDDLWGDLWVLCSSLGLRVLLVGDRFQLPPVVEDGRRPFSTLVDLRTRFRADLTEVCRQALDSPVIRASMLVRESEMGAVEALTELLPLVPEDAVLDTYMGLAATRALIVHRNATRQRLNLEVRARLGHQRQDLAPGEPLLVMFNNYQIDRFNGETLAFDAWDRVPDAPGAVRDRAKNVAAMVGFGVARAEGHQVTLSQEEVFAQVAGLPRKTLARAAKAHACAKWGYYHDTAPPHLNAELGYCLTAHKAQGSEWDDVVVVMEPSVRPYTLEGRRWLYTALTRAKKTATVCSPGW